MTDYELRLDYGVEAADVREMVALKHSRGFDTMHHFWDEPWWPDRYVIRILRCEPIGEFPGVAEVARWDSKPDAERYGDNWWVVADFFQASSFLAPTDRATQAKMVHCFLNAQGLSPWQEARFALRFAWNRATIGIRWRMYLKRRWQEAQV